MRALLSTYRSRGDVEPMVGLAVQLGALGAEVRVCAAAAEECDAPVATGVMPIGGWR
jgi:vancomycin aglycone glucosyltransferase